MLYVPGDDERKINKALTLGADSVCLDIEDGVAFNRKTAARETIVQALKTLDFGRSERLVRVNPVDSDLIADDLQAVLPARPDGILVPKGIPKDIVDKINAGVREALKDPAVRKRRSNGYASRSPAPSARTAGLGGASSCWC